MTQAYQSACENRDGRNGYRQVVFSDTKLNGLQQRCYVVEFDLLRGSGNQCGVAKIVLKMLSDAHWFAVEGKNKSAVFIDGVYSCRGALLMERAIEYTRPEPDFLSP